MFSPKSITTSSNIKKPQSISSVSKPVTYFTPTNVFAGKQFLSTVRVGPSQFFPVFQARNSTPFTAYKKFYSTERKEEEKEKKEEEKKEDKSESDSESDNEGLNDTEKLKKELDSAKSLIMTLKEEILRARAEAENTRKIAQRDVENAKDFGVSSFAKSILDVNDNLKRAIDSVKQYHAEDHPQLHALYEGVVMTKSILVKSLEKQGIAEYESLGQPFNPAVHEALFRMPYSEGTEPHTVGAVITAGYKLKNRVLRAAQVGVVDGKPNEETAPPQQ